MTAVSNESKTSTALSPTSVGLSRRQFVGQSALAATFLIGGRWATATPDTAQAQGFTPQVLSSAQVTQCQALGDALVPGAADAGLGAYIDSQLSRGKDSLLIGKYLGIDVHQQQGFYQSALDNMALLNPENKLSGEVLLQRVEASETWTAAPAAFFLFVLRADALDVVYGTQLGFAQLDIPYMAHITPTAPW